MEGTRARHAALLLIFAGALAVWLVFLRLHQHYVGFDSSALPPVTFLHYRLAGVRSGFLEFLAAAALWVAALVWLLHLTATGSTTPFRTVVAAQGILLALFLASPLPTDSDQYAYVGYGELVAQGQNPYAPPRVGPSAPLSERQIAAHWGNPIFTDRYGSAWTLFDALLVWPVRSLPLSTEAFVLRLAAAIAAVCTTLLLRATLEGSRYRDAAVAAFALNPLVIVACASGAHNDVFMIVAAVGAAYCLRRERWYWAAFLLGVGVAVKFAYAPLILPLCAYLFVRTRSAKTTALAFSAFVVPIVVTALPFGLRATLVNPIVTAKSRGGIVADLVDRVLRHVHGAVGLHILDLALFAAVVACAATASWQIVARRPCWAALATLLVLAWLFADKVEAWYALLLAPVLLIPRRWGTALFAGATGASMLMFSGSFLNLFFSWQMLALALLVCLAARSALGPDPPSGMVLQASAGAGGGNRTRDISLEG